MACLSAPTTERKKNVSNTFKACFAYGIASHGAGRSRNTKKRKTLIINIEWIHYFGETSIVLLLFEIHDSSCLHISVDLYKNIKHNKMTYNGKNREGTEQIMRLKKATSCQQSIICFNLDLINKLQLMTPALSLTL